MGERWRWTWHRVRHLSRGRLGGTISVAVVGVAVAEFVYWRHRSPGTHAMLVSSVEGLFLVFVAWLLIMAGYALWVLTVRSKDGVLIQQLQPGPDHVAAEQERVRNLRSRVGLIQSDLRSLRDSIFRMKEAGHYWDPDRDSLTFTRLTESGGQLAEDPRTTAAYQSCDTVRREVQRLNLLVTDRWNEWVSSPDQVLEPDYVTFNPPVQPADDLDRTLQLIRQADTDLSTSLRKLGEGI